MTRSWKTWQKSDLQIQSGERIPLKIDLEVEGTIVPSSRNSASLPTVIRLKDAQIEFTVPRTWKAVATKNGDLVLYAEKGAILIYLMVADDYDAVVAGMKDGLKGKLLNYTEYAPQQKVVNGITYIDNEGTGELGGAGVYWFVRVYKSAKPMIMYGFSFAAIHQTNRTDINAFMLSVKR